MKIDIPNEVIDDLRKLLTDMEAQLAVLQQDDVRGLFLYDTYTTWNENSDPIEMDILNTDTLELASALKKKLKL